MTENITETDEKARGHNWNPVAGEQIKSILERVERLEEEKSSLGQDIREVWAEAKGNGFDVKTLKRILKERKMELSERQEQEHLYELYTRAIGMLPLEEYAMEHEEPSAPIDAEREDDDLYEAAVELVTREGKATTSFIQRSLKIGFNRAARLMERLEADGHVTPADHLGKRKVSGNRIVITTKEGVIDTDVNTFIKSAKMTDQIVNVLGAIYMNGGFTPKTDADTRLVEYLEGMELVDVRKDGSCMVKPSAYSNYLEKQRA